MASSKKYGYRLFTTSLRKGYGNSRHAFSSDGIYESSESAIDDIVAIAEEYIGKVYFHPLLLQRWIDKKGDTYDISTDPNTKAVLLTNVKRHPGRIDFEFKWGKEGSHDEALSRDIRENVPLKGKAPANPYYVSLFLPKDGGTTGILMAEAQGRLSPGMDLLRYLACLMESTAIDSQGLAPEADWWNFTVKAISDEERLREQIEEGRLHQVKLEKHSYDAITGKPGKAFMEFTQRTFDSKAHTGLIKGVLNWLGHATDEGEEVKLPPEEAVKEISACVTEEVEGIDWDSGSVTFADKEGSVKTVSPENMSAFFTYPVQAGDRPKQYQYLDDAKEKVERLQSILKIELDL
ncbi:hypothetical protein [uncultured Rothia sp.]|uniref:hypothetical protein n=1 Tax=uncultured Rothia sp. TaxID=316088 RepID=UPI003216FBAA